MIPREFRELSFVPRFTVARTIRNQNVAEHTYYVTLYAMTLAQWFDLHPVACWRLAKLCLMADVPEAASGDMPSPFKKAINQAAPGVIAGIEDHYIKTRFPEQASWLDTSDDPNNRFIRPLYHVADVLEAVLCCATEIQMGNMTLGGPYMSDDMVKLRRLDPPDHVGANGVMQVVLVQLAKAWFALPFDGQLLLDMWTTHITKTITHHACYQSNIFDVHKDIGRA